MSNTSRPESIQVDPIVAAILADALHTGRVTGVRVTADARVRLDVGRASAGHRIELMADTLDHWSTGLADAYARFESHRREHAKAAIAAGQSPRDVCAALHAEGADMAYLIERTHALAAPDADVAPMVEYSVGMARTLIETYHVMAPAGLDDAGLGMWVAEHGCGMPVMAVTAPDDDTDSGYAVRFLGGRPINADADADADADGPTVEVYVVRNGRPYRLDDAGMADLVSAVIGALDGRKGVGDADDDE